MSERGGRRVVKLASKLVVRPRCQGMVESREPSMSGSRGSRKAVEASLRGAQKRFETRSKVRQWGGISKKTWQSDGST